MSRPPTGSTTLAWQCTLCDNDAKSGGGAWIKDRQRGGHPDHNTLENNAGSIDSGGLWLSARRARPRPRPSTTICSGTTTRPTGGDLWINNDSDGDAIASPLDLMHNNFNQTPSTGYRTKIAITIDPSNLDVDVSPFDDTDTQHLSADSPMIDEGDSAAPALPAKDMDGEERVMARRSISAPTRWRCPDNLSAHSGEDRQRHRDQQAPRHQLRQRLQRGLPQRDPASPSPPRPPPTPHSPAGAGPARAPAPAS